jgi:hypothetical protein
VKSREFGLWASEPMPFSARDSSCDRFGILWGSLGFSGKKGERNAPLHGFILSRAVFVPSRFCPGQVLSLAGFVPGSFCPGQFLSRDKTC